MSKVKKPLSSALLIIILLIGFVLISCQKQDTRLSSRSQSGSATFDVVYGVNRDYYGVTQNLALDVYYPFTSNPQHIKYPMIMFVHGGAFLVGDKSSSEDFCRGLADKGYVVAAINYRLGWNHDSTQMCSGDSTEQKEAQYRAGEDANAALRFLVSKAEDYSIDTGWIFLAGSSAGSGTVLHTAFVPQDSADTFMPGASDTLGLLDHSDNNLTNTYTIKGLASMWGGLYSKSLINASNVIPIIFFHGEEDNVVPLNQGYAYGCDKLVYLYGSESLYNQVVSFNVPSVLHIDPQGGHGVYTDQFRINNIACFFDDVINGTARKGIIEGEKSSCN